MWPFKVAVEDVPRSKIQNPNDAIVKITTTAICDSDLYMYEGRTAAKPGIIFGHENLDIVEEIDSGVTDIKVGDRVVMPFNIGCGHCRNWEEQYMGFCTNVNPGFAGGAHGYVGMGPYMRGQAEYLRVPHADFNVLKLPNTDNLHEKDFVLFTDTFPTGWGGVAQSGFKPGETIAMFGAGPVGLMAAYNVKLQGASKIFSVDGHKKILDKAKSIGAIPINRHKCDPVEEIISQTNGEEGVDRGVDAVGYQASSTAVKNILNAVLVSLVNVVRPTGGIGSPSLYVTEDPGASDEEAKQGTMQFPIGKSFEKGLTMGAGQCNVKRYNRYLRDLIIAGVTKPSFVVSHEIKIDETPVALKNSIKELKVSKVLIHPQW